MNILQKTKSFLGFDIKEDKYALVDDPIFGKVAKDKAPDKWVRSTCGYCGVGCGMYIGVKAGKAVYSKGDPLHPVNEGISDFTIHDEGYSNIQINEGIHPLLSTRHPDCAPLVGWVNQAGNSTCVYLMMGHDKHAYGNESFQHLVQNAIHWLSDQ